MKTYGWKKLAFLLKLTCLKRLFLSHSQNSSFKGRNLGWRRKSKFPNSEPSEWNPATLLVPLNGVILEKNVSVLVKVIALGNGGVKNIWQLSCRILVEAFCFFCHYPFSSKNFIFFLNYKTKEVSQKKCSKRNWSSKVLQLEVFNI